MRVRGAWDLPFWLLAVRLVCYLVYHVRPASLTKSEFRVHSSDNNRSPNAANLGDHNKPPSLSQKTQRRGLPPAQPAAGAPGGPPEAQGVTSVVQPCNLKGGSAACCAAASRQGTNNMSMDLCQLEKEGKTMRRWYKVSDPPRGIPGRYGGSYSRSR